MIDLGHELGGSHSDRKRKWLADSNQSHKSGAGSPFHEEGNKKDFDLI